MWSSAVGQVHTASRMGVSDRGQWGDVSGEEENGWQSCRNVPPRSRVLTKVGGVKVWKWQRGTRKEPTLPAGHGASKAAAAAAAST